MADILFRDDVSEDSDWGDDAPSSGGGRSGADASAQGSSVSQAVRELSTSDADVPAPIVAAAEEPAAALHDSAPASSGSEAAGLDAGEAAAAAPARQGNEQGCFYLVGLGLGDEKDITMNGLEIVRRCDRVFLEHYTAVLGVHGTEALAKFYGRPVEVRAS
jgi:hypothetical protein